MLKNSSQEETPTVVKSAELSLTNSLNCFGRKI